MENTQEGKEKFFAVHYGQDVLTVGNAKCLNVFDNWCEPKVFETQYLELKSLQSISDEDAIEVAKIFNTYGDTDNFEKHREDKEDFFDILSGLVFDLIEAEPITILKAYDFLRSKGYLVPYNGLPPEEIIKRGWAKYKTEDMK